MKNNKGLTLMELLAVIILIGLIAFLIIPTILKNMKKNDFKIDELTNSTIIAGTKNYLDYNSVDYPYSENKIYCITLKKIVDDGHLSKPLKYSTGEEINLTQTTMKITMIDENNYKYEIITDNSCTEN